MSYYTKGPWGIQGSSTINIISKANLKGRKVASIQVFRSEDRHNANLIAAVPDMLEALERIRKLCLDDSFTTQELEALILDQTDVIKKAKGL